MNIEPSLILLNPTHYNQTMKQQPNNLKMFRNNKHLTQKQVAHALSLQCEDRLSHWEKGKGYPSILNLAKLCKLYETTFEHLYEDLF